MGRSAVAALLLSVSWGALAHAQTTSAPPDGAPEAGVTSVEEVIVTANRREARLQDVPISVTALTAEALAGANIENPTELTQVVPALNIVQQATQIIPVIRGIGSSSNNQGDEANVATYIDGVYIADQTANFSNFADIERVEVLRGPQGTLFGRNATGGLLQIITRNPQFDPAGNLEFRYGNFNTGSIKAYVTAPLSDTWAFSIAGYADRSSGWIKDILNGGIKNPSHSEFIRGKLLFRPSDTAEFRLTVSREFSDDHTPLARFALDGNTVGRRLNPTAIIARGPFNTSVDAPLEITRSTTRADIQSHFDLGGLALETMVSYADTRTFFASDIDISPVGVGAATGLNLTETYTGELRLLSTSGDRFEWIAGVFGFLNQATGQTIVATPTIAGTRLLDAKPDARSRSAAVFGEGTFHVTDALDLIVGGRVTYEKRLFSLVWFGQQTIEDASIKDTRFTPRVTLKYDISPTTNVFATYSQGFKSGGFNTVSNNPTPVEPEELTAYELGIKSDPFPWLRVNATAFLYDYKNLQVISRVGNTGISTLQNAAEAEVKGGEVEVTLRPADGLTVRGSASYADATYTNFPGATANVPVLDSSGVPIGGNRSIAVDASGNRLIRSPKYTLGTSVSYVRDTEYGAVGGSINVFYSDRVYWDAGNIWQQRPYVMINGELFVKPRENVRLSLWVKNLGDVEAAQEIAPSGTGTAQINFPPRQYGVALRYEF